MVVDTERCRSGPIRTCVVCRRKALKTTLLRVVWSEGHLVYDAAQSLPGRGAYLHREWACVRGFGVEGLGLGRGTQRPKTFRRKLAQLARAFKVSEGELLADAGSDAFAVLVQELEEQVTIDEGEQATGKAPVDQTRRIKTRFF